MECYRRVLHSDNKFGRSYPRSGPTLPSSKPRNPLAGFSESQGLWLKARWGWSPSPRTSKGRSGDAAASDILARRKSGARASHFDRGCGFDIRIVIFRECSSGPSILTFAMTPAATVCEC